MNLMSKIGAGFAALGGTAVMTHYFKRLINNKMPDRSTLFYEDQHKRDIDIKQQRADSYDAGVRGNVRNRADKIVLDASIARAKYGPKFRLRDMKRRD